MNVGLRDKNKHIEGFDNHLVINLPDGLILRVIARSLLLAILIMALPWLCSNYSGSDDPYQFSDLFFFPMLFRDLEINGLIKSGDRSIFIDGEDVTRLGFQILLGGNEMDLVLESHSVLQSSIPDETFDFACVDGFQAREFIDRILKIGGIVVVRLGVNSDDSFRLPVNFKIAYIRRFDSTFLGLRKISSGRAPVKRWRSAFSGYDDVKKEALKGLEDVLLEPHSKVSSMELDFHLKRTKFLPDLMGDSLEGYPRRVFIDAGERKHEDWFERHYPMRNQDFNIYKVETVVEGGALGMSEWMRRNVKEEEYVVMQAEAEVVEEMVKSKAICLVDELFLECNHQGQKGKKTSKGKRAYWECLALYGKLRDQGVAVHQWWG
ncbi:uncharacterized protein LOC143857950 [Tasmannia lanceolata]|uniref:uncharacterized protein LOC143857950 n=1 Tax=Tasmannia lanceolata TaxID=3420 RepID=UPI00406374EF